MEGHYAIMYIDENVSQDFYYFVEDLKKRYNITCLCASKDGMLNIINCLNGKTKEKKVFLVHMILSLKTLIILLISYLVL